MEQRRLGWTERRVSAIGLGAMPLAAAGRPSTVNAVRVVHTALDLGVSWIDVADAYCQGERDIGYCETLVRRAIDERPGARNTTLIVSKGGYERRGAAFRLDCRREPLRAACHASLKALGTSRLFLHQLDSPDPRVYFPDSVGALAELQREGKIEHIGLCNVDVGHLEDASKIVQIATVQNRLSVCDRNCLSNGVLAWCERNSVGFIAHSPVGGHWGHQRVANHPVLREIASQYGATPYEIALAWLLSLSSIILPIPGATRVQSIASSVRASELKLAPEDLKYLRRTFAPANVLIQQLVRMRRTLRHSVRNVRTRLAWPAL